MPVNDVIAVLLVNMKMTAPLMRPQQRPAAPAASGRGKEMEAPAPLPPAPAPAPLQRQLPHLHMTAASLPAFGAKTAMVRFGTTAAAPRTIIKADVEKSSQQ